MSLYYEAAAVLANLDKAGGSLKSRIYNKKDLKSPPAQIVAVVTEASKWSAVLKDVIEQSGLLAEERKLTPILALLLTHDLLISKRGVVAPKDHVLKLAIHRHKARLSAEFTKARIRGGHATIEAFKNALEDGPDASSSPPQHPRWVRINTLKSTLEEQMSTTFVGYEKAEDLNQVMCAPGRSKIYFPDANIPNLLALPSKADLSKTSAYLNGRIIFQDKASCFPAYLIDPTAEDGDLVDGCAAPGNKTTHLAAILKEQTSHNEGPGVSQKVIAFERDKFRTKILEKMVKLASADKVVTIKGSSDFLETRPNDEEYANVGALLLDPSCSGSGIVGRDDTINMHLPDLDVVPSSTKPVRGKKRKRNDKEAKKAKEDATLKLDMDDSVPEETAENTDNDKHAERMISLSAFQLRILTHAMRFPKASKITYSTCSLYFEENEGVVFRALHSPIAKKFGWKILKRENQVDGLKKWEKRGVWEDAKLIDEVNFGIEDKEEVLDSCIRCEKEAEDGTMGFFVAAFVRDNSVAVPNDAVAEEQEDEEWGGFSDEEKSEVKKEEPIKPAKVAKVDPRHQPKTSNPKKKRKAK